MKLFILNTFDQGSQSSYQRSAGLSPFDLSKAGRAISCPSPTEGQRKWRPGDGDSRMAKAWRSYKSLLVYTSLTDVSVRPHLTQHHVRSLEPNAVA